MQIAFDIHTIGQNATGNEAYAEGLQRSFMLEPPDDIEFVYYQTRALSGSESDGRFRRLAPRWSIPRLLVSTPLALRRDRIDVAHFQYFAPPFSVCPNVITVHDLSFERHPEFFGRAMALQMRAFMPRQVRRAAHIIAVSQATRDDLIELYKVDPQRVSVVHNGVAEGCGPLDDVDSAKTLLQRFHFVRPFIVSIGNLGARKNQLGVVRAFARLVQSGNNDLDLVLVGKASESSGDILSEIRRAGLEERVHVTGFVSRNELVALYNLALFSVYVSLYEGFGLPILESMACGLPVLTSSVSCMPEIAGDAALLVDPRDVDAIHGGMSRLLGDSALRERLVRAGIERARSFTWSEAARQTANVYRKVHRERRAD